jgi:hypothetical protein
MPTTEGEKKAINNEYRHKKLASIKCLVKSIDKNNSTAMKLRAFTIVMILAFIAGLSLSGLISSHGATEYFYFSILIIGLLIFFSSLKNTNTKKIWG